MSDKDRARVEKRLRNQGVAPKRAARIATERTSAPRSGKRTR